MDERSGTAATVAAVVGSGVGVGVGVGDLEHAAVVETRRIMREAKGDRRRAVHLLLGRLVDLGLVTQDELPALAAMVDAGFDSTAGRTDDRSAYLEVRRQQDALLAGGRASPVALVFASACAGSYEAVPDGAEQQTGTFAKKGSNWQETLTGAGAVIGSVLGGPGGAAIGAAIGGVAGKIVDEC